MFYGIIDISICNESSSGHENIENSLFQKDFICLIFKEEKGSRFIECSNACQLNLTLQNFSNKSSGSGREAFILKKKCNIFYIRV